MIKEILNEIDRQNFEFAVTQAKRESGLPFIYKVWTQVYEGSKFENIGRGIDFERFNVELTEATKLYIHLSEASWDDKLLSEFRKVTKMIIAETGAELRRQSHSIVDGEIIFNHNLDIDPSLREHIQNLIDHFHKKELYESKADMARVKAQLTLTMNLGKRSIGSDMLQYAAAYEKVNQFDDCIQIYNSVVNDFQDAMNNTYANKNEQLAELNILNQAYDGLLRLTKSSELERKSAMLAVEIKSLTDQLSKANDQTPENNSRPESRRSWFNRLFGSN